MSNSFIFKKLITVLFAAALVFSLGITAFAEDAVLDTDNPEKDIDVYAKYADNIDRNEVSVDEDGNGSATLSDGTEITVSGADRTQGRLMIDLITETEALDWLGDVVSDKAQDIVAYHIYYVDGEGNMTPADGVTVTVAPKAELNTPVGYSVNPDGETKELTLTTEDRGFTFTVNGDPYYLCGEKASIPPTGDGGNIGLWLLLLLSGGTLIGMAAYDRKKA